MRFHVTFGILNVAFDTQFCLFSSASFLFEVGVSNTAAGDRQLITWEMRPKGKP